MDREIYLDNNATTRPLPEVRDAMLHALGQRFGNPSSAHAAGERARAALRAARASLAALIRTDPSTLVFTSGATEANNMVIASAAARRRGVPARIVTTVVEHPSILNALVSCGDAGAEIAVLPVRADGRVELETLEHALTPATTLVSVQWANSETGVIQPVRDIGQLCRQRGIPFHTDAAQAVGKVPIDVAALPVDFLSLSAHKFHGPTGAGALYVREAARIAPLLHGGPQEHGLRPGTENVPGIVGLGIAAALRRSRFADVERRLRTLRDRFESLILDSVPDVSVNGGEAGRLGNTTNLRFADVDGQALVARLDQHGVRCSQSTACTNRRPEPSSVLRAMGLSEEEAYASIRFSVGEWNTMEDIEEAARLIAELCGQLRAFRARYRSLEARSAEVS